MFSISIKARKNQISKIEDTGYIEGPESSSLKPLQDVLKISA